MSAHATRNTWFLLPVGQVAFLIVVILIADPCSAARTIHDLPRLFAAGRYAEAAALADSLTGAGQEATQHIWWRYRLETNPDAARRLALELLSRPDLPPVQRLILLEDQAWQALTAGKPDHCLELLDRAAAAGDSISPAHGLLAGLAHLAAGDRTAAGDALASVKPEEHDFCWSRWLLGELAREDGDLALARHYWESTIRHSSTPCLPELLVSLYELDRLTDPAEATRLVARLQQDHPGSLALLRLPATARPDRAAFPRTVPSETTSVFNTPFAGVAVQIAAFRDRGRAIAFRHRWETQLGDLRIISAQDKEGHVVYRVRSPRYADRRAAAEVAHRWRERFGLDSVIVNEQP